jgi:hypothetical protein
MTAAAPTVVASGIAQPASAPEPSARARTVRDAFWVWTHVAGAHNREWNLPRPSRMTPAEGALYLGVPNLLFIRYEDEPQMPFDPYAISFRPFQRVVWSLTGAGGLTSEEERKQVLDLATRYPNIVGFIMDDFFHDDGSGALSPEQLEELQSRLVIQRRKHDLYVVLYQHQLDFPVEQHLAYCDKITFWTWKSEDLRDLVRNFERLEKLAHTHGKLLGCYLWDYGNRAPMPLDRMKLQCRQGLSWLEEGRIEGMIFLASNVCDLDLESVEYTRRWIAEVGSQPL